MQHLRPAIALSALVASLLPASASAATYYVDPAGSDSRSGLSATTAWRTVARVNAARPAPGDQVLFRGGASWSEMLTPSTSGTAAAPVVYGTYGTGRAVLRGNGSGFAGIAAVRRSWLRFENLELRDWLSGEDGVYLEGGSDLVFDRVVILNSQEGLHSSPSVAAQRITFRNGVIGPLAAGPSIGVMSSGRDSGWVVRDTEISGAGDSCVIDMGRDSLYERVRVHDCGGARTYGTHGLYLKGPNQTLRSSEVWASREECVSTRYENARIIGNRLHGCRFGIGYHEDSAASGPSRFIRNVIWDTSTGIYISGSTARDFDISQNTVLGATSRGLTGMEGVVMHRVRGLRLENNVVAGNLRVLLRVDGIGTGGSVQGTNVFHTTYATTRPFVWSGSWIGFADYVSRARSVGARYADPRLLSVAPSQPDVRLGSGSPARDMGRVQLGWATLSYGCDGLLEHFCGSAPDAGAIEALS